MKEILDILTILLALSIPPIALIVSVIINIYIIERKVKNKNEGH